MQQSYADQQWSGHTPWLTVGQSKWPFGTDPDRDHLTVIAGNNDVMAPLGNMLIPIALQRHKCYRTVTMTVGNPEQLGAAIRATRKQLKVTQKDLAMTSGTGLRFVIDLEKGKATCQIGKILQVLQSLGLRVELTGVSDATRKDGQP